MEEEQKKLSIIEWLLKGRNFLKSSLYWYSSLKDDINKEGIKDHQWGPDFWHCCMILPSTKTWLVVLLATLGQMWSTSYKLDMPVRRHSFLQETSIQQYVEQFLHDKSRNQMNNSYTLYEHKTPNSWYKNWGHSFTKGPAWLREHSHINKGFILASRWKVQSILTGKSKELEATGHIAAPSGSRKGWMSPQLPISILYSRIPSRS